MALQTTAHLWDDFYLCWEVPVLWLKNHHQGPKTRSLCKSNNVYTHNTRKVQVTACLASFSSSKHVGDNGWTEITIDEALDDITQSQFAIGGKAIIM
jgi:hypothetical protein